MQSIDPPRCHRNLALVLKRWADGNGPLLAEANAQAYGAGLDVALSDRLSFGLSQGGYAVLNINGTRQGLLTKLGLPVPERDVGGQREGWLNLGGFVQYTLIANPEKQFLLTAGMRWEAPAGATQIFQGGANPAYLSPLCHRRQGIRLLARPRHHRLRISRRRRTGHHQHLLSQPPHRSPNRLALSAGRIQWLLPHQHASI